MNRIIRMLVTVACFAPLAVLHAETIAAKRPNIVFIITDDQGYGDISAHGNPVLKTPHLDRLRSESVRFEDFHVSPTCAPTRSALFTGRHEFKNGVTHTIHERERLATGSITLAQTLRDSGYATGIFGKWHLGDEKEYLPDARGFTEMFIHGGGGIGQSYPGSCGDAPGNTYFNPAIFHNGTFVKTEGYCTDVFFRQARGWMRSQHEAERPFFAYISTNAPHSPYIAKPEDAALYEGKVPSTQLAHFYGMIHNIDENIGNLLAELTEWGIERETIVIFMNDNGTALGETVFNAGMRGKKGTPFLGGTRASSFWRWPGIWKPGETKAFTAHIDVFPTLAKVTGAQLSAHAVGQIEGRSLKPLLENPGADWPDRHWFTHQGRWPKGGDPNRSKFKMAAVRNTRWAMVSESGGSEPNWQLFDLIEDYGQKKDVSGAHPEVIKELSAAYDRWWGECLPMMVNEKAVGPKLNPFAVRYWEQFGGGPAEADFKRMDPDQPFDRGAMPQPRKPNILFILTDDQSPFDFKFHNPQSTLDSPNIDRLASAGMIFDAAYHMGSFTGAVCTPSRHMIMSGRTVWRLPVGPGENNCPPKLGENTIGAVFNRAGYATMRTCKEGNSYPAANRQFSVVHDATKRGGTAESGSAWHAERVLDYLGERKLKKDERPFFIYFGLSHPHDIRNGTPELLAKYGATNHNDSSTAPLSHPKQPPLPPNWLPAHPFDNTSMNVRDETIVSGVWQRRDEATIRNEIGREYACSENIDLQIGRVLARLEEMGELENTYIFYTSDHGIAIGRHGLQGKQNLYEPTWRVPMIVKGPGINPGVRAPGNIYLGDLLATFCDLTGVNPPETNEGASFEPVLFGQKQIIRDTLYGAYNGGDKPGMRSVKEGDWKLIEYESAVTGVRETQLFNLKENPHEFLAEHHDPNVTALAGTSPAKHQVNLAKDPQHAARLATMKALLLAEMRRLDDPWRFSDQPDDGLIPPKGNKPARRNKAGKKATP